MTDFRHLHAAATTVRPFYVPIQPFAVSAPHDDWNCLLKYYKLCICAFAKFNSDTCYPGSRFQTRETGRVDTRDSRLRSRYDTSHSRKMACARFLCVARHVSPIRDHPGFKTNTRRSRRCGACEGCFRFAIPLRFRAVPVDNRVGACAGELGCSPLRRHALERRRRLESGA